MFNHTRMVLIFLGLLPGTAVLADTVNARDWSHDFRTTVANAVSMPATNGATQTWRTSSRFDELEFRDSSTVGRASKVRSLSLLTLAEFRKSRLFLGVNNRGLIGLHFRQVRQGDDRCLEVARMPWLRKPTPE